MDKELLSYKFLPSLFVFDIDYTLWPLWIDTHVSGPTFKAEPSKPFCATDKYGKLIRLYPDIPKIFRLIKSCPQTYIAVASRTQEPKWAHKVLSIMPFPENEEVSPKIKESSKVINYRTLADVIDYNEIYPGSKINHFSSLYAKTGIPYNEMIFFDDELRNKEVERELGVHFVHVSNGMTLELFLSAMKEFSKKREISFLN